MYYLTTGPSGAHG